ncbi:MAG TPA: PEP/pyruvate-binding domain-containing protein, partial [Acidimicrobiia bacterium]|nr:PEP/pyruvate-binding domain-containing protein [Acidimicrobiia bacterium]
MIHDLDHEAARDPARVGAKAAWLAMARRSGLPVLPGLVIDTGDSLEHMRLGSEKLGTRGSGGARLAMTAEPISFGADLVEHGARLGEVLVARSSTIIEASGEWAGAFTSYLDLSPADLPRAVTGCWASAFSVAALERQEAAGIEPGSFPMAVLVQPALDPVAGGTASIEEDGSIVVIGVKGSPAALLQGWSAGLEASRHEEGPWVGKDLVDLLGLETLDEIARALDLARSSLGANRCEWGLDGQVWLMQLSRSESPAHSPQPRSRPADRRLLPIARVVAKAAGPIGEELILPWALGGLPATGAPSHVLRDDAMGNARAMRDSLTAQVWRLPAEDALAAARSCMTALLGPDPLSALEVVGNLRTPDPEQASSLWALVQSLQLQDPAHRLGVGRWEPFLASVILDSGTRHQGTGAAPGVGAGISTGRYPPDGTDVAYRPRAVIIASQPIPNLAPLLWDAAGLVTESGSPAAHL